MPTDSGETLADFHRDGFILLGRVLASERAHELGRVAERHYQRSSKDDDPGRDLVRGGISLMRMFEHHRAFRDLLAVQPVIDFVEQVLGKDCHVIAQNALRTPPGQGIINWHIDDALFFPFIAGLQLNDNQALQLPVYSLNVLIALSDVESDVFGPTQVVRGSHRTGWEPARSTELAPGLAPTSIYAQAGDAYLINSQTWHRGAQNESQRTRYLITTTYGRRFISQRFYPFLNYHLSPDVLHGASDRLLRLLGRHSKGPYG